MSVTAGTPPTAFNVTGGGTFCNGAGVSVGLSESQSGVNYQLIRNVSTAVGSAINGNGGALDFGLQITNGTYTIVATNTTTGCTNNMTGNAIVTAGTPPIAFNVTGGGTFCNGAGLSVGLAQSQSGVNYQLIRNGSTSVGAAINGNGSALDFGSQSTNGSYTVVATNTSTGCTNNMTGSATVTAGTPPTAFNITGGGSLLLRPGVSLDCLNHNQESTTSWSAMAIQLSEQQ